MFSRHAPLFALSLFFACAPAFACDICSVYAALGSGEFNPGTLHLGVQSQLTEMDEARLDGRKVENHLNERLRSSITQLLVSYDVSSNLALQANVPFLYRSFRRNEEGVRRSGSEEGMGDLTLLLRARPYLRMGEEGLFQLEIFGGVKLPTGDSDRLREEIAPSHIHDEEEQSGADEEMSDHDHEDEGVEPHRFFVKSDVSDDEDHELSAVHGHDLAIGTGSVDFPFGAALFARHGRIVANLLAQYTFRATGSFDYRYGDDAIVRAGVGGYLFLGEDSATLLKLVVSGERKSKDKRHGESFEQTYMRTLFVGPEATISLGDRFSADIAWDIPVDVDTDGLMISPTSRIRFGATYRF